MKWDCKTDFQLYDMAHDPLELHDRASQEPAVLAELSGKLAQWVKGNLGSERTDPIYAADGAWTCYIGEKGKR